MYVKLGNVRSQFGLELPHLAAFSADNPSIYALLRTVDREQHIETNPFDNASS
jgi:hypothetical protein